MEMSDIDAEPLTLAQQGAMNAKRTGDLLYDIFPKRVADALKAGQKVEPEHHETVTVIFSGASRDDENWMRLPLRRYDILICACMLLYSRHYQVHRDLTQNRARERYALWLSPASHSIVSQPSHELCVDSVAAVCDMLDRLYNAFDACARRHQVFKVGG